MKFRQIRLQWSRVQRHFTRFTWGGAWAASLPVEKRQNLTLFFYDGLFSAASDRIILTYMTIYLLSLNVTGQQIGLLNSFSNFTAAFLLLPAALIVERTGERKQITLASATASRLAVLLMALVPLFLGGTAALIWIVLALALLREVFNNIGYPGWMALTGDIVPIHGRGRYFGTRNFIMGVAGILAALVVGEAITRIGEPLGYQLAFILAVILGVASMSFFARLRDPKTTDKIKVDPEDEVIQPVKNGIREIVLSIKDYPMFINFCIFNAIWQFSINISGPFFDVFMVNTLNFTAAMIGVTMVANTLANLLIQQRIGSLADKWGNRNVSIVFMLLIPILPIAWGLWIRQYWHVILIQVIAGVIWGAFNLASFNNLLHQTPENLRARFSAFYQIVVTLSLSVGALLGSFLFPRIAFTGVTLTSAGIRWLAALFFIFYVKEAKENNEPNPA